jgi:CheY-like chemotaxis protein
MPFLTGKRTILSVDDDEVNQIVLTSFLEGAGYQVIQVNDGQECLAYLEEAYCENFGQRVDQPDLVFLDVVMPGMDGYSVCREIRKRFPPSLPVIMISAKMTKEDVIHGLTSGLANDYLTKPFDRALMLAKIESRIAIDDSIRSFTAHMREDFCSSRLRPLLPLSVDVPVSVLSFKPGTDVSAVLPHLRELCERGTVNILEFQFGLCYLSSTSCDVLLQTCLNLNQKAFCFVMSPDRDLFRMIRYHLDNPGGRVYLTERFFSRLSDNSKKQLSTNLTNGHPFPLVTERASVRDMKHQQLFRNVDFLEKLTGEGDGSLRKLAIERRKYALMKEIVEVEGGVNDLKGAIAFEKANLDAIEHRISKAKGFRSSFADQLGLVDDIGDR